MTREEAIKYGIEWLKDWILLISTEVTRMKIKVIVAGKCVLCGKPIKLEDTKYTDKLPNIFFCRECEKKVNKNKSEAESDEV